ncbi:MAG TPA: hypothetical protein DCE11_09150 [Ruminiclostridium sp.]|jgi:hypothetical protein|nr:hypothetical protein [Clostridiaceae bacterium]HAA26261.1 hypothetical protein [Ruminiclostridium sp.]
MKKQVLLRWFWSILEYLMVFPVILIIAGLTFDKNVQVMFTLSLPFHMLVPIVITMALKRFSNLLITVVTILYTALAAALWVIIVPLDAVEEIIVTLLATCFFFIWGIRSGIGESGRNLFFYSVGLVIYGISVFFISKSSVLEHLTGTAAAFAVIYVIVGLPIANRRFLLFETREKSSVKVIPGSVMRGNWIITIVIIAAMLLLSLWDSFVNAVVYVAKGIAFVIGKVIDFFASLYEPLGPAPDGAGMEDMPFPAEEGHSIIGVILDILAILFLLFILFLTIRYIARNYKRILRAIQDVISGLLGSFKKWSSTELGYFDRQESILKTEMPKKPSIIKRIFRREPRWRDMKDNASRVRFIYTKFVTENIRRGFNFSCTETPAETIKRIAERNKQDIKVHEKIKSAYNSARYSCATPCDDTVNELKNMYLK